MRHHIIVSILFIGMFGGLFWGIFDLRHQRHHAQFKERVADICVEAAHRVLEREAATPKAAAVPAGADQQ